VYRARRMARFSATAFGLIGILGGLLVIAQASLVGFLRLAQTDAINDIRTTIHEDSLILLKTHYVFGSGFGSFVPLYQGNETPERMQTNFINHAHNDWMEMLIEGGLPAGVLMALGVVWLLVMAVRIWRYGNGAKTAPFQSVATIVIPLMLAHSAFDYPLRTPAHLVLFAFLCGIMTLPVMMAPKTVQPQATSRTRMTPGTFRPTASSVPPSRPGRRAGGLRPMGSGHTSNTLRLQ
jgi:O-antigen ligase